METVVLPARDHLAHEFYRPPDLFRGGLPRARRKVRSPHQVFVPASWQSDIAKSSRKSNVHVADSTAGLISPMDMSLASLRSAPSPASTTQLPPSSVLKAPQYRLNNASAHEFSPREYSFKNLQQQLAASLSNKTAVANSTSVVARQVLSGTSDAVFGEFVPQVLKRGLGDRRMTFEKGADTSKTTAAKIEKNADTPFDKRRGLVRRSVEKKALAVTNSNQVENSSNVQQKSGVIIILQRPLTKEAAAENVALFNGGPIEDSSKQVPKSSQVLSQHLGNQTVKYEVVKDVQVSRKAVNVYNVQSKVSRIVSPKKGSKKKPSREFSGKATSRAAVAEGPCAEKPRRTLVEDESESRRPKTAPRPADVAEVKRVLKSLDSELGKSQVSSSSVGHMVPKLYMDGKCAKESVRGMVQASAVQDLNRISGRSRDVSRGNDHGGELFFLPSSPPVPSERWAGPGYTNSPPPNTLPFPTFPLQRVKSSIAEVTAVDMVLRDPQDTILGTLSPSSPQSPTPVASLFSTTSVLSPFVDRSSPTKDLRKKLNLNMEDVFGVSAVWGEDGVESATLTLKRMLQLD